MHVFILSPRVVLRARVAAPLFSYPFNAINYENATIGVAAAVKVGMTVRFGSAAGKDDYGRQHISQPAVSGGATSGAIFFGITSRGTHDGEVNFPVGAWIDVLDDYRVWAKIPYIYVDGSSNTVILKDGYAQAVGNVEVAPPVANGGAGYAATIDAGTGRIEVDLNGSNSFYLDNTVSTGFSPVTNFSWDLGDGSVVSGSLTSASLRASFPPGFRYVALTVTANGKSHTCRIPVFARDPNNDLCVPAQIVSHRITPAGQEVALRLFNPLDRDIYPDGTLVMIFDDVPVPFQPTEHRQIFVGWHQSDQNDIQSEATATLRTSVLTCVDVAGRLATLPGFTQIVTTSTVKVVVAAPGATIGASELPIQPLSAPIANGATLSFSGGKSATLTAPARVGASTLFVGSASANFVAGDSATYVGTPKEWFYTSYNTLLYYFWYLLFWHSTALEVADLIVSTQILGAAKFFVLGSDENNLLAQVNDIANIVTPDHFLTCNRRGQLKLVKDQNLMAPADRETIVATLFSPNSCLSMSFSDERPPTVGRLVTWGTIQDSVSAVAVKCQAPGYAEGQGASTVELTRRYCAGQTELNTCEGNRYAKLNRRHGPATFVIPYELINFVIEPADMPWTSVTIGETPRPYYPLKFPTVTFTEIRGVITEMNIAYDYSEQGTLATATIRWEEETSGPPAVTVVLDVGSTFFK